MAAKSQAVVHLLYNSRLVVQQIHNKSMQWRLG